MRAMMALVFVPALAGAAPRDALMIPVVGAPLDIDGELDELAWKTPARTGSFLDAHGELSAPYSDARFLRSASELYLALYAGDEDIRSTDEFVIELSSPRGHRTLHVTAGGEVTGAHARARVDVDGSVDRADDDDEEWVVEAAVPLAEIPFGADGVVQAKITRCDLTKDHVRRCGSWRGALARR